VTAGASRNCEFRKSFSAQPAKYQNIKLSAKYAGFIKLQIINTNLEKMSSNQLFYKVNSVGPTPRFSGSNA